MILVSMACLMKGDAASMTELAVVVESVEVGAASVGYFDFSVMLDLYIVVVVGGMWLLVSYLLRREW